MRPCSNEMEDEMAVVEIPNGEKCLTRKSETYLKVRFVASEKGAAFAEDPADTDIDLVGRIGVSGHA